MTKEELSKLFAGIRRGIYRLNDCLPLAERDLWDKLGQVQAEFERYIDVLEPLEQHPCFYFVLRHTIKTFMEKIEIGVYPSGRMIKLTEYLTEWSIVSQIISRAIELLKKKKEPTSTIMPEFLQGKAQLGITQKITIRDANKIDTHYLTFENGRLTDYTLEGKTAGKEKCPHCGKEIE